MPRITQYSARYKVKDFCKWIEGERITRKATQTDFGDIIGVSRLTYAKKMSDGSLSLEEAFKFIQFLQPSPELMNLIIKA